jgi:hypothetical protein
MNWLFGWRPLSNSVLNRLHTVDRAVVIFPHTSSWDIITLLSYITELGKINDHLYVVIRRSILKTYFGKLVFNRYLNPLPVDSDEDRVKTGGFIETTVNKLKNKRKYLIFMSPEGSREYNDWKSGYFVLAQQLQVPIVIFGFDFEKHEMKTPLLVDPDWSSFDSNNYGTIELNYGNEYIESISIESKDLKQTVERKLQKGMSTIAPLYPRETLVEQSLNIRAPTVVKNSTLFVYLVIIGIVALLLFFHPRYTGLGLILLILFIVIYVMVS